VLPVNVEPPAMLPFAEAFKAVSKMELEPLKGPRL